MTRLPMASPDEPHVEGLGLTWRDVPRILGAILVVTAFVVLVGFAMGLTDPPAP